MTAIANTIGTASTATCPTMTLTLSGRATADAALATAVAAYSDGYKGALAQTWSGTYATTALPTGTADVAAMNGAVLCAAEPVGAATAAVVSKTQFDSGAYAIQVDYGYTHSSTSYAQLTNPVLFNIAATTAGTAGTLEIATSNTALSDAKYGIVNSAATTTAAITSAYVNTMTWYFPTPAATQPAAGAESTSGDRWNTTDKLTCFGSLNLTGATFTAIGTDNCGSVASLAMGAQAGLAFGAAALASALAF